MREAQRAADQRAAEATKRAEAFTQHLKKLGIDPERFAQDPDKTIEQYTHDFVRRKIEEAEMDPRELELRRKEETLTEREQRLQAEEKTRQQQEQEQRIEARTQERARELLEELKSSGLPQNPFTLARMASLQLAAAKVALQTGKPVPKERLAAAVAEQLANDQTHHVSLLRKDPPQLIKTVKGYLSGVELDGAQVAELLGPKLLEVARKHLLTEAQSKFSPQPKTAQPRSANARLPDVKTRSHKTYHTLDEWNDWQQQRGGQRS